MTSDRATVHPVLACADVMEAALKDVVDVDPVFMSTNDKATALLRLGTLASQVEAMRLRVLAVADDVADRDGAPDAGVWLSHKGRIDRAQGRRSRCLAEALDRRWPELGAATLEGRVSVTQAEVIVRALEGLPADIDPDVKTKAEQRLLHEAASFGPRSLRVLGRRVLDVLAPELAEEAEGKALEREEREAAKSSFVRSWRRGNGTTELRIRISDTVADRFLTYLQAFTSPRKDASDGTSRHPDDRRSYPQRLAHAFGAFLEAVDPGRLPLHGGDATTVMVTVDINTLRDKLHQHGVALVGDEPISASEARRLACTANILPAVLGGDSHVLDLGRTRRLFNPAQRKALALRDVTCRAEGCDIPAAWCEAHHARTPWAVGGRTDLADGALLCSFHHHRAHEARYETRRGPDGRFSFHRRP